MCAAQTKKTFKAGEVIMTQGEEGQSAYIIEDGRVAISIRRPDGTEQSVGTRGPGTMIGEMALVDKAPRTATVTAIEDCHLLEINQKDFSRRLESADPVLRMTTQVILTRYRDTLTRADISGENRNWPPAEAVELNYAKQTDAVKAIKIANDFKSSLGTDAVYLNYQPIIDLRTGYVAGFEALMRWEHPEYGTVSPNVFIPVAEESGFIVEASQWALKEACMALKRMENRTGSREELFMSVNFSSRDFASADFTDSVYDTISKSDLSAHQIHLEITERLLMDQPDNAKDTLDMCRKAGMSIAIDDFGTGYSSLSYLHYFPIDTLKIDRSFVADMNKDEGSLKLVKSIVDLGKNMGMKVVAEGVETAGEAAKIKELGGDYAQGFYFSTPLSEAEAIAFISKSEAVAL